MFWPSTLFGIYLSLILREAKQNANLANLGVGLRTRFHDNLFSTSRLKAKTVCEALYADDAAICCHSEEQLQSIINSLSNTCSAFGLKISVKKTVTMNHGTQVAKIILSDEALEIVEAPSCPTSSLFTKELKAATSFPQKPFGPTRA